MKLIALHLRHRRRALIFGLGYCERASDRARAGEQRLNELQYQPAMSINETSGTPPC